MGLDAVSTFVLENRSEENRGAWFCVEKRKNRIVRQNKSNYRICFIFNLTE